MNACKWSLVIGHWSLVISKEVEIEKGRKGDRKQETGDRGQFRLLELIVLTTVTALRTSPAGKRSPSEKNGIFSAVIEFS
ncbi:MAG: hypothetical protein KBG36_00005 [Candidatus Marinimicrobia bacterium]|nr:hypothetical protein [Candidatus Neomarinimicrobiota bacterium]